MTPSLYRPPLHLPSFCYRAHGLLLSSEVELPEAVPARFGELDVTIRYGDVPPLLTEVRDEGAGHQVAPGIYRLEVRGVGVYGLRGGREIVVAPAADASPEAVRAPLLSSVLGAAVHERGYFAMHASAVALGDGCVLFTGMSGAGKSTLAAACHAAGMSVISDDLVAIEIVESGLPLAHPGYRLVKLWSDSIDRFGGSFEAVQPLEGLAGKFGAFIPGSTSQTPLPVRALFDLRDPVPHLSLTAITGASKLQHILRRMYRSRMISAFGHSHRTFIAATSIARTVPMWSLQASRNLDTLAHVVTEIRRTTEGALL